MIKTDFTPVNDINQNLIITLLNFSNEIDMKIQ